MDAEDDACLVAVVFGGVEVFLGRHAILGLLLLLSTKSVALADLAADDREWSPESEGPGYADDGDDNGGGGRGLDEEGAEETETDEDEAYEPGAAERQAGDDEAFEEFFHARVGALGLRGTAAILRWIVCGCYKKWEQHIRGERCAGPD